MQDQKKERAHYNFRVTLEGLRLDNLFGDREEMMSVLRTPGLLTKWQELLRHACVDRGIDLKVELERRTEEKGPESSARRGPAKQPPAPWEWDSEDDEKHGVDQEEQIRIVGTLAHDDPGTSSGSCSSSEHAPCVPSTAPEALRAKRNAAFAHLF